MSKRQQIYNYQDIFSIPQQISLETCFENKEFTVDLDLPSSLCSFTGESQKGAEVAFGHKSGNDNFVYKTKTEVLCFHFVMLTPLQILSSEIIWKMSTF